MTPAAATTRVKRHPIRSGIAGLIGGIGAALMLGLYGVITIGTAMPFIVIGVVVVLSVVWGFFAPARKKRARPANDTVPSSPAPPPAPSPASSPAPSPAPPPVPPSAPESPSADAGT